MPLAGFEPAIPAFKRLQSYVLGRMAAEIKPCLIFKKDIAIKPSFITATSSEFITTPLYTNYMEKGSLREMLRASQQVEKISHIFLDPESLLPFSQNATALSYSHRDKLNINLLKSTGHVMHQQFNIQQLYALPTLYLCVLYLSENKQRLVPLTA